MKRLVSSWFPHRRLVCGQLVRVSFPATPCSCRRCRTATRKDSR